MKPPRAVPMLVVAAPASGQGKTTVCAALARAYARQGLRVRVFKTGPDFLDPLILERASGAPVENLDLWMAGTELCRQRLALAAAQADLILIEGVMGLFDGAASAADIARTFNLPLLLVVDASAMAQTFAAIVHGLTHFDPRLRVWGVIANRVASAGHAAMLGMDSIQQDIHRIEHPAAFPEGHPSQNSQKSQNEGLPEESQKDIHRIQFGYLPRTAEAMLPEFPEGHPSQNSQKKSQKDIHRIQFGYLPRTAEAMLPERHLGLTAASEINDLKARLDAATDALVWDCSQLPQAVALAAEPSAAPASLLLGVRIAVARDAAFCFIYEANLEVLRAFGAELHFFSPIAGDQLPPCDGLYLPGGYPELHLAALAANRPLMADIQAHHAQGKPLWAECGGLLYLCRHLTATTGESAALVALIQADGEICSRLQGLSYQQATLAEGSIRGHSFHFGRLRDAPPATQQASTHLGAAGEAIYRSRRLLATFVHSYWPAHPLTVAHFFYPGTEQAKP